MAYQKIGPRGELLSTPESIGNVLVLPYRLPSANKKRRKHSAKILEFARQMPGTGAETKTPPLTQV